MSRTYDGENLRTAFNEGCQARLTQRPKTENPYSSTNGTQARKRWFQGWESVDSEWGVDSRKVTMRLKEVVE